MSFLLDTNVISEWVKPRPHMGVITWLEEVDEDRVFLSVVTLTELRYGIERLAPGRRRSLLDRWLTDELPPRFEGRLLNVTPDVAERCGGIMALSEARGRRMELMDAFLAATAEVHRLTLVTRNTSHFAGVLPSLVNPWR